MSRHLEQKVTDTISPSLEAMGYDVVRIALNGSAGQPCLQIMAEHNTGQSITVEECRKISQTVSALLDVEDLISGRYTLEVSSPGIDRPLTRLKDFIRFSGHNVKIEIDPGINGQKRFKGRVTETNGDSVSLENEEGLHIIPFHTIQKAKLVLTDELLHNTTTKNAINT